MTARQEFQTILDLMTEEDVNYALELVKDNFAFRRKAKSWADIPEIDPDDDDFALVEKINNRLDGYGDYITQETLLKILHEKN